jgi:hypothetical protein
MKEAGSACTCSFGLISFFQLVGTFPGFSEEFCANQKNVATNRKRGISLCCLQKSLANSKGFGVKRLILIDSI